MATREARALANSIIEQKRVASLSPKQRAIYDRSVQTKINKQRAENARYSLKMGASKADVLATYGTYGAVGRDGAKGGGGK